MNLRLTTVISALALVAFLPTVGAQTVQFDLGLGYQWENVEGNQDLYKTHVGENEGVLLDSLNLVLSDTDSTRWYDQLRVVATGIGESPDTRFRFEISRNKAYRLKIGYMRSEVYNYLPGYANPFIAQGIVPGQHTLDRRRERFNLDLELLPGGAITPLLGYTRGTYKGSAGTTFHIGEDEFRMNSDYDETSDEYRAGIAFSAGGFRGAVVQGWRTLESQEDFTLADGAGGGNNSRPVLGRDVTADTLTGTNSNETSTPFTNAYVTGNLFKGVRLVGSYARVDGEADFDGDGEVSGQLVSFMLRRFFESGSELVTGKADSDSWRGEARVEVEILRDLDLLVGYTTAHHELDGHTLSTVGTFDTTNFSGGDPKDIVDTVGLAAGWERDEDALEGKLVATPLRWLRVWGAAADVTQEVKLGPKSIPTGELGEARVSYDRDISRYSGGFGLDFGFLTLGAEYLKDDAEQAVVATDYAERERLKGRIGVKIGTVAKLTGTAEKIELSNPDPNVRYEAKITHWAAQLEVMPIEALVLRAGYDAYKADSTTLIRRPQDFSWEPSVYLEDGTDVEAGLTFHAGPVTVDLGGNRYSNEGDLAFDLDRDFARIDVGITGTVGIYGQYERRKYDETALPIASYDADRYGLFLRWGSK